MKDNIEKYKNGLTTKQEEDFMFKNTQEPEIQDLGAYIKSRQVKVPNNLNEQLWLDFERRIDKKNTRKIWKWSAAASIVLFVAFYANLRYQNHVNEIHNGQLLEEAISMFSELEEPIQPSRILFEDETLIVYTKTEK